MKKPIISLFTLLLICSCSFIEDNQTDSETNSQKKKVHKSGTECLCPDIDDPVCTKEGITLKNECVAKCQGLSFSYGSCF